MKRATIGVSSWRWWPSCWCCRSSVYTVDQRKAAIKFQLGEVIDVQTRPGLYFLVPFLQNVRLYDTRIQTMEPRDPERFLTSENRNVLVDSFVKWRVIDVRAVLRVGARRPHPGRGAHRADGERRAARRVRQAHGARRGVGRARQDHERCVTKRVDEDLRRIGVGDRRRAPEARRLRARDLLATSTGAWNRRGSAWPTSCAPPDRPRARRSRPTPTASAR